MTQQWMAWQVLLNRALCDALVEAAAGPSAMEAVGAAYAKWLRVFRQPYARYAANLLEAVPLLARCKSARPVVVASHCELPTLRRDPANLL